MEGLKTWWAQDYVSSSKTAEHFNRPHGIATFYQQLEKNYSAELFFFNFWVFEVRRFRNPTNKISMALAFSESSPEDQEQPSGIWSDQQHVPVTRREQVIIFRLHTGHCKLQHHLHDNNGYQPTVTSREMKRQASLQRKEGTNRHYQASPTMKPR
jgi:hypothetical protein